MSIEQYKELYKGLQEIGFMGRNRNTYKTGDYTVTPTINCLMEESCVKVTINKVTVLEFFSDGSAWVVIPSKLDGALAAVNEVISNFKKVG